VHRVSNRLGLVTTRTPEETEESLTRIVPVEKRRSVNELFVLHGQSTCRPAVPRCSACPLTDVCGYYQSGGRHK
jgi:endonuclease-3